MKKTIRSLKYDDKGLIPAIVQDAGNLEILMMAYMNAESLARTVETGYTHFWSRSRQKFWMKGETSGHVQEVKKILYDCDRDTLVVQVVQHGPGACHTGHRSCFFTELSGRTTGRKAFSAEHVYGKFSLESLYEVILARKGTPRRPGSHTAALFRKGKGEILRKLGEETTEALVAVALGERKEVVHEMADVWYHLLVAMAEAGVSPRDVMGELERRAGRKTTAKKGRTG